MSPSSDESRQSSDDSSPRLNWLERYVAPFARRFGRAPAVRALREALPISFVGLLVGLGLIVAFESGSLVDRLHAGIPGAFAVMSVVLVVLLAVRLALELRYGVLPGLLASLGTFALALPPGSLQSFGAFALSLGTSGLFTAIVCCLATAGAILLARRRIGGVRGVLAGGLAICAFAALLFAVHVSLGAILSAIVAPLGRLGDSFFALFAITAIETVLFLFGIHGPALLAALVLPVYIQFQFHNTAAWVHHQPLPYLVTVSTFLFVFPGGTGATLPLVLLLMRSRVTHLRRMAFATLVPSLCNVNEPLIFGLPIVYNPILGIPYVLAPLALVGTTYAALSLELTRRPIYYIPTPVPLFLNVMLATLDWHALVLLAVNLVVAGLIYWPFVRMYERAELVRR